MHIVHIVHIKKGNDFSFWLFFLYCLDCFVPHHSAQLLTNHHLQPSAPSLDLWTFITCCARKVSWLSFAFQRESFLSAPLKQVGAVPVWRKLELHTRLEIVHCARRRWRIDTYPPILERERHDHAKYAKYAEYAKYDLISVVLCTPPAQKQKHTRAPASQRRSLYGF